MSNPYKKEIIGIASLGPALLILETWRRWGNLLSYDYLDDVWLVGLSFIAAYYLKKKTYIGQLLWLFTCGCALSMITGSFFSQFKKIDEIDASGFDSTQVIAVKAVMYILVILMSIRAFRLLLEYRLNEK